MLRRSFPLAHIASSAATTKNGVKVVYWGWPLLLGVLLVAEPRVVGVLWLSPTTTLSRWSRAHIAHTLDRNYLVMGFGGLQVRSYVVGGSVVVVCRS